VVIKNGTESPGTSSDQNNTFQKLRMDDRDNTVSDGKFPEIFTGGNFPETFWKLSYDVRASCFTCLFFLPIICVSGYFYRIIYVSGKFPEIFVSK
jgi:hypothetical protein